MFTEEIIKWKIHFLYNVCNSISKAKNKLIFLDFLSKLCLRVITKIVATLRLLTNFQTTISGDNLVQLIQVPSFSFKQTVLELNERIFPFTYCIITSKMRNIDKETLH